MYCLKQVESSEGSSNQSPVSMSTTASTDLQEAILEASIAHCYYIKNDNTLLKNTSEEILMGGKKYIATRDTGSQISIVHSDLIPQDDIIPGRTMTLKGIGKEYVMLKVAEV